VVPDTVMGLALVAALDDATDAGLEDLLPVEQPATPPARIVAAPTAINNSRLTESPLLL
jgi:hypothetical protein